jgi:hypothetical protein
MRQRMTLVGGGWRSRLVTLTLFAWVGITPGAAADHDGLSIEARQLFYNERTAIVAVADLAAFSASQVSATVRGMFDDAALTHFEAAAPGFLKSITTLALKHTGHAAKLIDLGFSNATLALRPELTYLAGLPIPPGVSDETFTILKFGVDGLLSQLGLKLQIDRKGETLILHPLGFEPTSHSQPVENAALDGLRQASPLAAAGFALPMTSASKALLPTLLLGSTDFAALMSNADYAGGFLVTGERPELHLHVRYAFESEAVAAKAGYDATWSNRIAAAAKADQDEEALLASGTTAGKISAFISREEMTRRFRDASRASTFGHVLLIDLDTADLRAISSAFGDRNYRKP